jgi:hypothetical protein
MWIHDLCYYGEKRNERNMSQTHPRSSGKNTCRDAITQYNELTGAMTVQCVDVYETRRLTVRIHMHVATSGSTVPDNLAD